MREYHVRICEGLGVKFPGSTRQSRPKTDVRIMSVVLPITTEQRTSHEVGSRPILLQKSLNAERRFSRLKSKQARTANKSDSRPITEVTGEFSATSCDPPHPYMKNAPMAQKFCDQGRKTTFATKSANKRPTALQQT